MASCSIPYFNFNLHFIVDGLALALNSLGVFTFIVPQDLSYGVILIFWGIIRVNQVFTKKSP